MAASSREVCDRKGREQAGECDPGQRPPDRCVVVPKVSREVFEHADLDGVNELEKAPRRNGDDETHEGREDEHDSVSPASDQRGGIGREGGVAAHPECGVFVCKRLSRLVKTLSLSSLAVATSA
jgi:hypothetical protein